MTPFTSPRLLADIGGTYARFTLETAAGVFQHVASLRCAEHADFHAAVTAFLAGLPAGLAQAIFQLPSLSREGYRYQWVSPWRDPTVREVVRKMLPASIGVAAFQINVLVTQCFSFWFDPTIVATHGPAGPYCAFPGAC
jgi:peptidoglycan biosynthesis protein MviN/MurJ (putative lipid II flippase)